MESGTPDSTTDASESSAVLRSLLDLLKSPTAAEINQKRKVKTSLPPVGKCRSGGNPLSDPKGIQPSKRVLEF